MTVSEIVSSTEKSQIALGANIAFYTDYSDVSIPVRDPGFRAFANIVSVFDQAISQRLAIVLG